MIPETILKGLAHDIFGFNFLPIPTHLGFHDSKSRHCRIFTELFQEFQLELKTQLYIRMSMKLTDIAVEILKNFWGVTVPSLRGTTRIK
jgi:hypothetical protein